MKIYYPVFSHWEQTGDLQLLNLLMWPYKSATLMQKYTKIYVIPLSIWGDESLLLGNTVPSGKDCVVFQTLTAFLHLIQNSHRLVSHAGLSWVTRMQLLGSLSLKQKLRTGPRSPLFYKLAFHYPYCFYCI